MGLTIDKILVIMVIAMFILGPERLPLYAKKLGDLVKKVRRMASGAKDRMRDEMGPEFDQVDWKQLDPRQYDPRRIVRDALLEDEKEAQAEARRSRASQTSQTRRIGGPPPESTSATAVAGVAGLAGVGNGNGANADQISETTDVSNARQLFFDEEAT